MSLTRMLIAVTLLFSAAANAADPPAPPPDVKRAATAAATPAATTEPARAPLKLQIGDVRKYMMPNEYRAAINAPDAERTTIVVEGERPVAPLQSELPLPSGLAAYYTLFRHPTKAWRLLLPDPNGVPAGPPDVVPQREFRWGP